MQLPIVLNQQEVITLIAKTKNLIHRAVLTLTYSWGLLISEVLNLRLADIDIDWREVYVHNGKARKDRYVGLVDSFITLLTNNLTTYAPKNLFIEGRNYSKYSAQSLRVFLKKSCDLSGIKIKSRLIHRAIVRLHTC